jgi:hypothetical protein
MNNPQNFYRNNFRTFLELMTFMSFPVGRIIRIWSLCNIAKQLQTCPIKSSLKLKFNRKQKMGAVFIDIQKAFDSVWHTGLLWKLHKYAIPQYLGKLLQSYLLECSFVVRVNQTLSLLTPINSGVPQGSVLGPILFLLFFSDIPCTDKTTSALFSDDLCFWYSHGNLRVINNRLQNTLDKI